MQILELEVGSGTLILGEQMYVRGRLDTALVSSHRLSKVTIPLTKAACLQFAMQVFEVTDSTPVYGMSL